MPLNALKAMWIVQAGIIPGTVDANYTRRWNYLSEDFAADQAAANNGAESNRFTTMMKEASDYALSITNPAYLNWVRTDFMWM